RPRRGRRRGRGRCDRRAGGLAPARPVRRTRGRGAARGRRRIRGRGGFRDPLACAIHQDAPRRALPRCPRTGCVVRHRVRARNDNKEVNLHDDNPYAAPNARLDAAGTGAVVPLYSPGQVAAAGFLGGPVGLIWFLKANFAALGNARLERKTVVLGIVLLVALVAIMPFL